VFFTFLITYFRKKGNKDVPRKYIGGTRMSKVRVRQSKNRLRSSLSEEEIEELRRKIRDPSYIDYVAHQIARAICEHLGSELYNVNLPERSNESSNPP
jgi:hypothetical protein